MPCCLSEDSNNTSSEAAMHLLPLGIFAYPLLPPSQTAAAKVLLFVLYVPTTLQQASSLTLQSEYVAGVWKAPGMAVSL